MTNFLFHCRNSMGMASSVSITHGHHFFCRGGEEFFLCVHGSEMAIGKVMFLTAIAWVKGGKGEGRKILT